MVKISVNSLRKFPQCLVMLPTLVCARKACTSVWRRGNNAVTYGLGQWWLPHIDISITYGHLNSPNTIVLKTTTVLVRHSIKMLEPPSLHIFVSSTYQLILFCKTIFFPDNKLDLHCFDMNQSLGHSPMRAIPLCV